MERGPGMQLGDECGVPVEVGCGRLDDVDTCGVEEGVGASGGVDDAEVEGVAAGLEGMGEEGQGVVRAGALRVDGGVAEVPDAGGGMGGAVAEVEGVGRAAFPQGVGEGYPVNGVVGHLPTRFEEVVVAKKGGDVDTVATVDGKERVDDDGGCEVGAVVVIIGLPRAEIDGVVEVVARVHGERQMEGTVAAMDGGEGAGIVASRGDEGVHEGIGYTVAYGVGGVGVVGVEDGECEMNDTVASGGGVEAVDVVARFVDGSVVERVAEVVACDGSVLHLEGRPGEEGEMIDAVA